MWADAAMVFLPATVAQCAQLLWMLESYFPDTHAPHSTVLQEEKSHAHPSEFVREGLLMIVMPQ